MRRFVTLIGKLAKATDVSSTTIRYYETLGLLKPARCMKGTMTNQLS